MFSLSQFILQKGNLCNEGSIPSYSIAIGILFYASIYLYILYGHSDYASIFNRLLVYVVGIDLLVSCFMYMGSSDAKQADIQSSHYKDASTIESTDEAEEEDTETDSTEDMVPSQESSENDEQEDDDATTEEMQTSQPIEHTELEQMPEEQPKRKRGRPRKQPQESVAQVLPFNQPINFEEPTMEPIEEHVEQDFDNHTLPSQ
jgi:hypothetical protein